MGYNYTSIDGERVETAVGRAYLAFEAEFRRVFGLDLAISSGTRTRAEQQYLWDLYQSGQGNLAAYPGTSNHEEFGPRGPRALDLRDSGDDAGITRVYSHRSIWARDNCGRFGFINEGYNFSPQEGWHFEYAWDLDNGAVAGDGSLTVDGEWGYATTAKLQSVLGVTVDGELGPQTIAALQRGLGVPDDGDMGPQTIRALQAKVGATVDGELGPDTIRALQIWLNGGQGFTPDNGQLQEDGQWGPATTRKFQHSLGVGEDGELGPETWKAFQTAVGIPADGEPGPQTYKALQINVGAEVDGQLGPDTITKLQQFLNAGKTWEKVEIPEGPKIPAAVARTPEWEGMVRAWMPPLAYDTETGELNFRPADTKINRGIVHHTGTTADQEDYFKSLNDRSSCPSLYVNKKGEAIGFIPLYLKPSSTGSANAYSIAIETQNTTGSPTWGINDRQHETIARFWAWVSEQSEFQGVEVDLVLDRTHIIGHNEAGVNATACPGPSMNLDLIVVRANELTSPDIPPPTEPPVDPDPDLEVYRVIKPLGKEIKRLVDQAFGD
jgi:peptidoglycan hydrolase-like protein with peptidoglycan-binding domain